jgi:hypothetical protein
MCINRAHVIYMQQQGLCLEPVVACPRYIGLPGRRDSLLELIGQYMYRKVTAVPLGV